MIFEFLKVFLVSFFQRDNVTNIQGENLEPDPNKTTNSNFAIPSSEEHPVGRDSIFKRSDWLREMTL